MKKNDIFWQTYLKLEKELLEISKYIYISSSEVIKRKNLLNSRVYREIGGFSFEYFSVHSTAFTV